MSTWDERYSPGGDKAPLSIVQRAVCNFPPGTALDLACGLGRHALYLARHGWSVTALDSSEVAISRLRESAKSQGLGVEARIQDLTAAGLTIEPGAYDLICDCLYLQHSLLPAIRAGVRVGGLVILALPMFDESPGLKPMNPQYLVRTGEVRSWFADWTLVEYREEGESPAGRKLAQLIAQRPCGLRLE